MAERRNNYTVWTVCVTDFILEYLWNKMPFASSGHAWDQRESQFGFMYYLLRESRHIYIIKLLFNLNKIVQ